MRVYKVYKKLQINRLCSIVPTHRNIDSLCRDQSLYAFCYLHVPKIYRNTPKNSDIRKVGCNNPKIEQGVCTLK